MSKPRTGRVYRLLLEPPKTMPMLDERSETPTVPPQADELIRSAFSPASCVTRYRRDWIVGQTTEDDGVLRGRLGIKGIEDIAEIWDEERKDFATTAVPAGAAVPFAIDLNTLVMVVQPRGRIEINGIAGAVKMLLNEATGSKDSWSVRAPGNELSFKEWREGVSVVRSVRFTVRKPNPHYRDTPDLQHIMEETEADIVRFEAKADHGLDLDAGFLKDTQVHVEAGYGEARYVGERVDAQGHVTESVYYTEIKSEQEAEELPADQDGEVSFTGLAKTLGAKARRLLEPRN